MPAYSAPIPQHSICAGRGDSHRPVPSAATTSSPRGTRVGSPLHVRLIGPSREVSSEPGSPPDIPIGSAHPVSINVDPHDLGTASAALGRTPQIGEDSGIENQVPTAERAPPRDHSNEALSSLSDRMLDPVPEVASRAHSPRLSPPFFAPLGLEQDLKMFPGATRNRDHKHTCPVCGQFYRRPYLLKDHIASHQPTKGKRHLCDFAECGLTFTSRSNMKRHFKQKHHGVGGTQTDSSPVERASCAGNSIEPKTLKVECSGGSITEQNITNSPIPSARKVGDGPIRKEHSLQPLLNGPSMVKTTTDSSRELDNKLAPSTNRKRSGEPKYALRVKLLRYGTAYTPKARTGNTTQLSCSSLVVNTDYRAFNPKAKDDLKGNGATRIIRIDLQAANIEPHYEARQLSYTRDLLNPSIDASECVACILTPVPQFESTKPMKTKHIIGGEDTQTGQDMANVYDSDTTTDCAYMHVANGTVNAKYSALLDSVGSIEQRTHGILLGPFIHPGYPILHPHPKVLNIFIKAVATVINCATTVRIPAKHLGLASTLSPTDSLSGTRVFLTDHHLRMSQDTSMPVSHFFRSPSLVLGESGSRGLGSESTIELSYLSEPEQNMGLQDSSHSLKQLLDVLFSSVNAFLPLAHSEGVSDDITHALLKLFGLAQARASFASFPASLIRTRCKEPHLSPFPPQTVISPPLFNQANPGFSTGNLVIFDPCTPGSTKFRMYAPSTPRFTRRASFPFATKVKPSYQDPLPKLDINQVTNPRAWHVGYDFAAWDFSHDFKLSASRATRKTLPMDVTSISTSRAPVPQCTSLSAADASQPVPESSLKSKGKDRQRHTCPSCDRTFRRPYLLKDHMQSKHRNGERPYACDFEECNRAFSTRSNLRKHFRIKHTDLGRMLVVSEMDID